MILYTIIKLCYYYDGTFFTTEGVCHSKDKDAMTALVGKYNKEWDEYKRLEDAFYEFRNEIIPTIFKDRSIFSKWRVNREKWGENTNDTERLALCEYIDLEEEPVYIEAINNWKISHNFKEKPYYYQYVLVESTSKINKT